MKKIYAFILLLFSIFGLTACEDKPSIPVVNQFIVIFDSVGGSSVQKQIVDKGNTITKPTDPTKDGYTFEGWYWNNELFVFTMIIDRDMTLTAHWSKLELQYTVEFDTAGGNAIANQVVKHGDKIVEPIQPIKEGYTFDGWFLNDKLYDFSQPVLSNLKLIAKWTKKVEVGELTGYYEAMNGHLDSTFKNTLHTLLKETHNKKLSYSPETWTALKELDEDPNNSDNIICIYTGRSIPKANQDTGSSGNNIWNREHSWPNSHGFGSKDYAAYTDIHHLFASEKNINATRGNKDFNVVTNGNSDSYGNKWNNTFFEPRDEVKGDLARAMFYLVVRYDDPQELDLELSESVTSSSSNKTGQLGILSVLLEWHKLDPVSEKELERNEKAYKIQGNRNPFIDYPDWVSLLYPNA